MRPSKTLSLRFAALALAAWVAAMDAASAQESTRTYQIAEQSLGQALREFALASKLDLLFSPDLVAGKKSSSLDGKFTIDEGLRTLLRGSGLEFSVSGSRVVVSEAKAAPARQATSPTSTLQGPNGYTRLAQAEAPSSQSSFPATTSQASEVASQQRIELEEILVTGSRLRRTDQQGPSPVITITREDIDRSGAATPREVLNTLSQSAVSRDESANSFLGASTVQLRGLSAGSTLVLINGRRASLGSFESPFDLNSLPLDVIERIEVLTDTASAVYGADAIGGAVNFILKRDYDGVDASLRYGTSDEGGAAERAAGLTIGSANEKYSGLMALSIYDRDPLFGRGRELSRSSDFTRFGSRDFRNTASYPANVYSLDGSNLPGLNSSFAGVPAGTDGIGLTPADFAATDGVLNRFDGAPFTSIVAESTRVAAFATGSVQVTPAVRLFGEALYSRNDQIIEASPDALAGGAFGLFIVPAENPFNPFGVPVGVDYRFMDIGPRTFDGTMEYSRALVGASGPWSDRFNWEVSVFYDRNEQTAVSKNHVSAFDAENFVVVQQLLNETDPNLALNVFSTTGNNNPQTLRMLVDENVSTSTTDGLLVEAVVRGQAAQLPAGDLQIALGASARRDEGAFDDGFGTVLDASKKSWAVFAETSIPLISPSWSVPALYSAEATVAVRLDHYDTFGSETNPQFGLLWRPVRSLLLRGSYGEAFKAPSLNDLYAPVTSFLQSAFDPLRDDEFANFDLLTGGNEDVKPERASALTVGVTWDPEFAPGLSLGATAFRIDHDTFITRQFDFSAILSHPELFGDRIVRAPPTPEDQAAGRPGRLLSVDATALNFGGVTVRGMDAELKYTFPEIALGRFVWSALASYVDEYEVQLTPDVAATNEVGKANRAGYPTRFKGISQLSWNGRQGLGANVTARYLHSYADYADFIRVDRTLPAQTLWDIQASYQGGVFNLSGVRLSAGVINLTDEQGSYSNSLVGYDYQQADLRGRFFYVSLNKKF